MKNGSTPKPVLLVVLDGIRPDVLQAAIRDGDAPALGFLAERGEAVWDAVSVFPSITPAATAAIVTGEAPAGSGILGHAWYDREEERVVVYGAMRDTVISTGPLKVFHNNVWRMNRDDLRAPTLFETLHERGIDGACVNFPVRRGPHEHPTRLRSVKRVANRGSLLGTAVDGPKEYFMGDLFYSRDTGLHGRGGVGGLRRSVGINDAYAAGVGAMLLEEKAAPFTLVYFFKGDSITHHKGLAAQRRHVTVLDGYVEDMFDATGGPEKVLEDYAVLVLSDHGHTPLLPNKRRYVRLGRILGHEASVGSRIRFGPRSEILAVPNGRSAFLYLGEGVDREKVVAGVLSRRGVDLAAWREEDWGVVRRLGRELRFRPSGDGPRDAAGRAWELSGDRRALEVEVVNDEVRYGEYPDALERLWGCLLSPRCGDVVLSATPGYTFGEVAGDFHEQSDHGSLHASDSNLFVLASGVAAPRRLTDVAPTLLDHFGSGFEAAKLDTSA
ncbi:MAG: alkaline phosphatase family protein [Actinobacteria bacterium]|nr:alkaline phosphatase family protein [Actinomycetota bacterium]MCA1737538.1 alkaline phosphatase family protein [Actinomycetota bacterium]